MQGRKGSICFWAVLCAIVWLGVSMTAQAADEPAWDGATSTKPEQIDGVYQISNGEELAWFAELVNGTLVSDGSVTDVTQDVSASAVLTQDIHLNDKEWISIAEPYAEIAYQGTFNGQGHTIYGLKLIEMVSPIDFQGCYVGLFGIVGEKAEISNLTVEGSSALNVAWKQNVYIGSIAAVSRGQIDSCVSRVNLSTIHENINNLGCIGGICGRVTEGGSIRNCVNIGELNIRVKSLSSATGKIVGHGGIVGAAQGAAILSGCTNQGKVQVNIAGEAVDLGGILGLAEGSGLVLENCCNEADLTVGSSIGRNLRNIGGIAGFLENPGSIRNCWNAGDIIGGTCSIGGITGLCQINTEGSYHLDNLSNVGDITAQKEVGGLIGVLEGGSGNLVMEHFYNLGDITAQNTSIGGIVGIMNVKADLSKGYNSGTLTVSSAGASVGALIGNFIMGTCKDVYAKKGSYTTCIGVSGLGASTSSTSFQTVTQMASDSFLKTMNGDTSYFVKDTTGISEGAPVIQALIDKVTAELPAAKSTAIRQLDSLVNLSKYRQAQKTQIEQIISKAKSEVNAAGNSKTIEKIVSTAKSNIAKVKTDAQLTKEEQEAAKALIKKNTPAKPSLKKAKASTTYQSIQFTWSKTSNTTGYYIYRKTGAKGSYKKIATVKSASKTSYTDKKAACGTVYYYTVKAYHTVSGKTYTSSYNSAGVKGVTYAPAVPKLKSLTAGSKKMTIKWAKASKASGYQIYMATSKKGTYKKIAVVSAKKVSYVKKSLKKGKTYYFKVRAYKTVSGKKVYGAFSSIKSKKCK